MYFNNTSNSSAKPLQVSKENPCPHCGKPDWCYSIGELSVCNRDQPPVTGWQATSKADQNGHFFYAPVGKKAIRPAQTRYWEYLGRDGSLLVRVRRIDFGDGRKKDIKQQRWDKNKNDWVMGLGKVERASIPIYRYADVRKAITNNQQIFIVDGEPCADALWVLGLAATTSLSGAGKWGITDTSDLQGAKVVICPDRDIPGVEDAVKISQHFPEAHWLYCYPDSWAWDNLPKSQGLDVKDWIDDKKLKAQDILNSLIPHPRTREEVVCQKYDSSGSDYILDTAPTALQNFVQKAEAALYSDGHWKSIGGQLYYYVGSHYELRSESEEKRRIGDWLNTYAEKVKGVWVNNRAKSSNVAEVLNWVVNRNAVDPNKINPDGLNCSNGVVRINPDGSHSLVPHDPNQIYTYVGSKYDPDVDSADCDRLLECLEPAQREIFLRTAAAALSLKLVRSKLTGRGVKGLLCYGEGSNGKDTLRAVLAAVFGRGMTGKSLSDFKSYDNGRKFSLAGIEGSLCNWASENTAKVDLDTIQSLKQFITGDPIDIERKGKDSYEYKSAAIFFANCNKLPSITGGTSAIDDRYGILRFDKTYVRNAITAEGQLEADPRFKDDEKFILEQVAPAMLNKLLERLPLLLSEGIDYKATKDAMQKAQEESRHLWQFAREFGLEVQSGGRVWVKDLWDLLVDWYEGMGILDKEYNDKGKEKLIWNELPNKYDAPVKAINQLASRFSEIFPKVQVCRHNERDEIDRRGQRYLLGIGFVQDSPRTAKTASPSSPVDTARNTASPTAPPKNTGDAVGDAKTLTQSGGDDGDAISSPFTEICNLLSQLTDSERQKLTELLTQSQLLPDKVTPEDAQKMRDIALVWWLEYYPEQMQALMTQMYGWQTPGTKYDVATLAEWLKGEDDLIRDRITELIHRRRD
jgi:putative DNA primase/helicase